MIIQFSDRKSEQNEFTNITRGIGAVLADTPVHCSVFNYAKSVLKSAADTDRLTRYLNAIFIFREIDCHY